MNRILRVTLLLVLVIALAVLEAWAGSNKADLSRTVFLGDSLTAGFQNSSLLATQQVHGYAAVNTHFAAGIPPVSIRQVQKSDPLVLPGVGHPASALGHISPETAAALRAVMGR